MGSSFRTIAGVATYRPLSRCNFEELAAYQNGVEPSGGILFARNRDRECKDQARELVLKLFSPQAWPGQLDILTMPSLDWRFERKLLGAREQTWMYRLDHPRRTSITSIENDRSIFHASLREIPGCTGKKALLRVQRAPRFAEQTISTRFVRAFHLGNVDDLMLDHNQSYDAVWLDYNGPLSERRLQIIAAFYQNCIRCVLILTALKARWDRHTSAAIDRAGSHAMWVQQHLPGEVEHSIEYQDSCPMSQITIRKFSPLWCWAC
jgi:hypothetical protein